MPKVSVIIPVYGVEQYIERCVRSLFGQTLDDIEYLFIDDCTPDNSIEILNKVLEDYPNRKNQVFINKMEHNKGLAFVRRWGVLNTTGDYVIHCDSDDWVDTDMYRAMYQKAIEDNADVVVCDFIETDGLHKEIDVRKIGCHNTDRESFLSNVLFHKDCPALWNKLFRRTLYSTGIYFPDYYMAEDLTITSQLLWSCERISYVPEVTYFYYINTSSDSQICSKEASVNRFETSVMNVKKIDEFYSNKNLSKYLKAGMIVMKEHQRSRILPLINNYEYYKKWRNAFPENNRQILWNRYVPIKHKILYLITLLHLYPYYAKMRHFTTY